MAAMVNLEEQGKMLDIGTGSGSLIIKLAKAFPESQLTGIDYWGSDWEYSEAQCRRNAELEGVSKRVTFLKAAAKAVIKQKGIRECLDLDWQEISGGSIRTLQRAGATAENAYINITESGRSFPLPPFNYLNLSSSAFARKTLNSTLVIYWSGRKLPSLKPVVILSFAMLLMAL